MLQLILDWLLPRQCYLCSGYAKRHVCDGCLEAIKPNPVTYFEWPHLAFMTSIFDYTGSFQKMMHGLKFQKMKPLSELLVDKITLPEGVLGQVDYWVPVVPHKSRLKTRGFNPVDLIFEKLLTQWGGHYLKNGFERVKETPFLHELSPQERLAVLAQVFIWKGPDLKGKRVVIVDDIFTTGATVSTLAKLLNQSGAKTVGALTLSYVVLKGRKSH